MNPFLGVLFHWLGGLASGSFYVPYKGVKKWSWETYWLVGGIASWIICPSFFALLMSEDLFGVLQSQSMATLWWTFLRRDVGTRRPYLRAHDALSRHVAG